MLAPPKSLDPLLDGFTIPVKVAFCDASNNKASVPTVKNFIVEPSDSARNSTLSLSLAFSSNLALTVPLSVKYMLSSAAKSPVVDRLPEKVELPEVLISNLVLLPCLNFIGIDVSAIKFAAPPTTLKYAF